jgi:hypothetical protein
MNLINNNRFNFELCNHNLACCSLLFLQIIFKKWILIIIDVLIHGCCYYLSYNTREISTPSIVIPLINPSTRTEIVNLPNHKLTMEFNIIGKLESSKILINPDGNIFIAKKINL